MESNIHGRQFRRFFVVGLSAATVDFLTLNITKRLLNFPLFYAVSTAYLVGLTWSYHFNSRHTFEMEKNWRNASKFLVTNIIGLLLTDIIVLGFARVNVGYNLAKLVALIIVFFWNFLANKFWVFAPARQ